MTIMLVVFGLVMAAVAVFALSACRLAKRQDEWDEQARLFWEACDGE